MPELPEVETIVRDIRPFIMGKMINGMIIKASCQRNILKVRAERFYEQVIGGEVVTVLRKGKYIILPLSNNNVIVMHLGMSGRILLHRGPTVTLEDVSESVDKHTHLILELIDLSDGSIEGIEDVQLHFNDPRTFGKIYLLEDVEDIEDLDIPGLKALGPDALGISHKEFQGMVQSKRAIKSILLDQTKIAGVGNIYADEALFEGRIHPTRPGSSLNLEESSKLRFAVKAVLKEGIRFRGSSTSDYLTADGSKGSYQDHHRVYRKTGQKCVDCGSIIQRIVLAQRGTHFCPTCQPER
jgi:formamidopyrimidine-DNA glycosylase